jgi:hypothetical protein
MASTQGSFVWYELMTSDTVDAANKRVGDNGVQATDPQGAAFALLGPKK